MSINISNTDMFSEPVTPILSNDDQIANEIFQEEPINSTEVKSKDYTSKILVQRLPSLFKSYKLITNKPEIYYKPYKVGQLAKINQSRLSTKELFLEILEGIECNFNKRLLTISDFTLLGLQRRIATFKSVEFNATWFCEKCNKQSTKKFKEKSLDFHKLECELPVSYIGSDDFEYILTPLTVDDYLLLYDLDKLDDKIALYAIQCRSNVYNENNELVTDKIKRFEILYQKIYDLNTYEDEEAFDYIDKQFAHSLKPVTLKCENKIEVENNVENNKVVCNHEVTLTLDGGSVVITPFRKSNESIANKISFGKRTNM